MSDDRPWPRMEHGSTFQIETIVCPTCGGVRWTRFITDAGPDQSERGRMLWEKNYRGNCRCPSRSRPEAPTPPPRS
jgi:hypothetical protein